MTCEWCGAPLAASTPLGRPRRYCSIACRREAGHYREALPARTARLLELTASARAYSGRVPAFLSTEIVGLRHALTRPTDSLEPACVRCGAPLGRNRRTLCASCRPVRSYLPAKRRWRALQAGR